MSINFNGFKENALTFLAGAGVSKGSLVKISANKTASPCASGDNFCGICTEVRDGYCTVIMSGYVNIPAAKLIPTGYQKVSANSSTAVTASSTGRELLVVESTASSVGLIL